MTNFEHNEEKIIRITKAGDMVARKKNGEIASCADTFCEDCCFRGDCIVLRRKWMNAEYKPFDKRRDWPIDILIWVWNEDENSKILGYFAGISNNGETLVWANGRTSVTGCETTPFANSRLASETVIEEMRRTHGVSEENYG